MAGKTKTKTRFSSLRKVLSTSKQMWPSWKLFSFRIRRSDSRVSVMDGVVFRILSVVEVVVLVSTLCFFYLCCGCHF
ncbi:hypothetical protein MLD38_003146 [Melastoma candidum]|uniref:Uncharacterized protein n=1 Tax=Melastoma candidum TaxID=119954 RepID=A0ACB9S5F9_9MYRT|nr:hypothetical protein MLD38_003146 [Melastoma candidum]